MYLNLGIVAVAAAAAGAVYWYAWRPLPETSGTRRAPLSGRASIARDASGMPHITAESIEDALFLQGFAAAQDRMWQMDTLRRAAGGTLAEVFGPAALQLDREARRLRMERLAELHTAALAQADRAVLAAYARGVNFYLETHRGAPALEFRLAGYDPRPWRIVDSVLIGLLMYRDLTTTWMDDLRKAALLAAGDREKAPALFAAGAGAAPGSNAWVISGRHTASGKPLLANDPHLEYSIPGIWHAVHLRAPGLDVAGVDLPGMPCVIIGHNDRIAWGVTNLGYDVQDLYLEKMDLQTGRYAFRGQQEQARLERDVVKVKGGADVEYSVLVTRHGPVAIEDGRPLALRWAAAEADGFQYPFLDLNRARNWTEFRAALARYPGPGQNFVYADVDGNIGYQATGRLPVRRKFDGDVPADGSSGDYEWDGFIPFEELPTSFNPPSGRIVTANQNPFPASFPYRVGGNFAAPYRARQIEQMLRSREGWRASEMVIVQKDVYSDFLHTLAKELVAAYERRPDGGPAVGEAIALLRGWNGQMEKRTAAPLIATLAYQHIRKAVTERALPGKGTEYAGSNGAIPTNQVAPVVIERLLHERPKDWFDDWDRAILRSFRDAVEEGQRMQGDSVRRWDWGAYNRLTLVHPVGSQLPLVSRYFNIGPVEQSGSGLTVKQTTRRLGPSMRMAVDLADWDRSQLTLLTGISAHVLSSHYKDQWDDYYAGRGRPFPYRRVQAEETLVFEPQ